MKKKIAHEMTEFLIFFLFLFLFFGAFAAYRSLLLRQYEIPFVSYGTALISALIMAKIIMIGKYAGLGKKHEQKALIVSAIYKAFVFGLLAIAFHVLEEAVRALIHHERLAEGFQTVLTTSGRYQLQAQGLVLFCEFVPFFAITEQGRVLGNKQLYNLFFRRERLTTGSASTIPPSEMRTERPA